jgi:hypothetical protein
MSRHFPVEYDSKEFQGAVEHILKLRGQLPTGTHKRKAEKDLRDLLICLQNPDTRSVSGLGCLVIEWEHLDRTELESEGIRVVSIYIRPSLEHGKPRRLEKLGEEEKAP